MRIKRVLVAPLDWGLGHTTRCIPVIHTLLEHGFEVILGGSNFSLAMLENEFPSLQSFQLPAYNPVYSASDSMIIKMAVQMPRFIRVIKKENQVVHEIVKANNIDIIISDNRYGCWSSITQTVFITHQITIQLSWRWLEKIVNLFNVRQIKKFHQCWVPDAAGKNNLTGSLSSSLNRINAKYIGVLSRFSKNHNAEIKYDVLILLSGPEPQRTLLEKIILAEVVDVALRVLLVRGVKGKTRVKVSEVLSVVDFMDTQELQDTIRQAEIVVARSGYSTIMDLAKLEKKAIFIPTPGQTEQEYLADRMKDRGIAYSVSQKNFNLSLALRESEKYTGFKNSIEGSEALQQAVKQLL